VMRKPSTTTASAAKPPVVTKTPVTSPSIAAATTAPAAGAVVPTSTAPAIDPSKVNEEVAKRMAAEKARLEALARTQNQPATTPGNRPATTAAAAPPPQPVATQPVAPPPVAENRPAPPVVQPPAPQPQPVAESRPVPQPEKPRTQVGDLVSPGTPGLTPAHTTRQATATYPPMARIQRVQGSVTISALISETGRVLETKIINGAPMGLNEAADQSIRRSTFAPGEKDGVRVKSWTTVRVDFKL